MNNVWLVASGSLLALIGGWAGWYLKSYFSESGKLDATISRLDGMTRIVEDIKSDNARHLAETAHRNSEVLESIKAMNQLRMAALDKRLEAHQRAFALWRRMYQAVFTNDLIPAVKECSDWWDLNCLYLTVEARQAFANAFRCALEHKQLAESIQASGGDAKIVTDNFAQIRDAVKPIMEGVHLPPLSRAETDALAARPPAPNGD